MKPTSFREAYTLLLLMISFVTHGQGQGQQDMELIYDDDFLSKEFIEKNFKGGYSGYVNFFQSNLSFPEESYKNQIEGLQLFYFEVFPTKNSIEVHFLTYLDSRIQKNIKEAVEASKSEWLMTDNGPYRIYQPIVYSLLPYYPQTLIGNLPELPADLPLKFQQMFVLIKSKRIDPDFKLEDQKDTAAISAFAKKAYVRALGQYNKMMQLEESSHAYDALNELIRYNPLNRDFLTSRIKLEQSLGVNKYQAFDSYLLSDFVDAKSTEDSEEPKTTFNSPLNTLYADGYIGYENFVNNNFGYPISSAKNKIEGTLMVAIHVSATSEVRLEFLTKLDTDMEKMTSYLMNSIKEKWKKEEKDYTLYQPFFFNLKELYPDQLEGNITSFKTSFDFPVLEPIFIIDNQISTKSRQNQHLIGYNKAEEKMDSNLTKGKFAKALENLNVLIRYNPFDQSLLEQRVDLEKTIGVTEYSSYDQLMLKALKYFK